jgi:HD domain
MSHVFVFIVLIFSSIFAAPLPSTHTGIYAKALAYATQMHDGQTRKVTKEPYIVHPIEVGNIIAKYGSTDDADVLIAALLHDIPEDTKNKPPYIESSISVPKAFRVSVRFKEIYQLFGQKITELVYAVTQVSKLKDGTKEGDWLDDNFDYAKHLNTHSQHAILLSAADKLSNLRCMIMELAQKIISNPDDSEAIKIKYWANFGRKKYPDYVVLGKFVTLLGLYKLHLKDKYPALVSDLHQAVISIWNLHHSTNIEEVQKILADNTKFQQLYKENTGA